MTFPNDHYTPYGYLNTPNHTRTQPVGVLRSYDVGFRWHVPSYPGLYGGLRETYRAGMRLGVGAALKLSQFDQLHNPYHSSNCFVFDLNHQAHHTTVRWLAVGDHALVADIDCDQTTPLCLEVEYTRLLAAHGQWGESGLVGRVDGDLLVLQGFEDGEALVVWLSHPWQARFGHHEAPTQALPHDGFFCVTGRRGSQVALYASLQAEVAGSCQAILARGRTLDQAKRHLAAARQQWPAVLAQRLAEDASFWATAPRLSGDWPAHWRRGLVYDLETVRMMVRPPTGIYQQIWDAMQIHQPRVVLAEAAMDALLLGYVNPGLAQQLLLATFQDAPLPNVPCSREDGSYNMLAADGTVCGTAPSWGYPLLVAEWLWQLQPDRTWLQQLYPFLQQHLTWWLNERRDAAGWLVYACSWESGQDDSPRFGPQPLGGGHPVRHVRPVDLTAAMAHGCRVVAEFAAVLGQSADHTTWAAQANHWQQQLEQLWHTGRYADYDQRAAAFSPIDDPMLLAPFALKVASPQAQLAIQPLIQQLDPTHLTWPMIVWTACEAGLQTGLAEQAAHMAAEVIERAYGFWDAPVADPQRTLPGVACEYWPPDGRCGGEGYGWGAFTTHLLLRVLLGFEPTPNHLILRPNLPLAWRVAGRSYQVTLHWRSQPITIILQPRDANQVTIIVDQHIYDHHWGEPLTLM